MALRLKDPIRLKQLMLMSEPEVSARRLAKAAGYNSHSYVNRLLSGEASTVDEEPAARIARYLRVELDFLFVPSTSTVTRQNDAERSAS